MLEWIQSHETTFWWLAATSTVTFVTTLIVIPLLAARIPADYFTHKSKRRHRKLWADKHPVSGGMLLVGKNLLGYVFVVTGIIMLVLPGQGLLTILVGIMLLNFPGKYRLERWVVTRRPVLRFVNWLRRRAGRSPLVL